MKSDYGVGKWYLLMSQERKSHLTLVSETNRQTLVHKAICFTNREATKLDVVIGSSSGWGEDADRRHIVIVEEGGLIPYFHR